jgi:lactate permease
LPYLILVTFLILAKVLIGKVAIPLNLGFETNFNLFNPGFVFVLVTLLVSFFWRSEKKKLFNFSKVAFRGSVIPFIGIATILAVVQIMISTGYNSSGLPSVISLISKFLEGNILPVFAPLFGAFGSFLTGSVTTSNVMFGALFNGASLASGLNAEIILSFLIVGAGLGGIIGLADIITAEAVIGVKNKEVYVVKNAFLPCLLCLIILILVGLKIFQII